AAHPILLLAELANERRQIHSGLRRRVNTSVSSFSGQRELTERCAMAALAVYAARFTEFPPRAAILTSGTPGATVQARAMTNSASDRPCTFCKDDRRDEGTIGGMKAPDSG